MSTLQSRSSRSCANRFSMSMAYLITAIADRLHRIAGALRTLMCGAMLVLATHNALAALGNQRPKHDEPDLLLRIIAQHVVLQPSDTVDSNDQRFAVQCPNGYVPA